MSGRVFNIISLVFLVMTVLVIIGVTVLMLTTSPKDNTPLIPTIAVLASETVTNTPKPTLPPTFTPTFTATVTPSITPTLTVTPSTTPTVTASPTITTSPTITQTPTITPTPTLAPTETPVPTLTSTPQELLPTISPYLFDLKDGQIIFTTNFANAAGCAWQGIAGQVFDINNSPMVGLNIHIFGQDVDRRVQTGSNSLYGISGWEIPLGNTISNKSYFVELESAAGTVISSRLTVTFPSDCTRNLALANFIQVRAR